MRVELIKFYRGDWSCAFAEALNVANHRDAEIVFPDGTLEFPLGCGTELPGVISNHDNSGTHRYALPVIEGKNITLRGQPGTRLCFNGRTVPFLIRNCADIRLESLQLDWKIPFYSQGRVTEVGMDYFDVTLNDDEAFEVRDNQLFLRGERCWGWAEIDSVSLEILPGKRLNCGEDYPERIQLEHRKGRSVRFSGKVCTPPFPGSILVLRHGMRDTPAIVLDASAGVNLCEITIYHAGGMGIIAQNSRDLHLERIRVTSAPDSGRAFSTCADATHFVNCSGKIIIENSLFEHQLDDGSNIHGVYAPILENSGGKTLLAELRHPQHRGLSFAAPGDRIRAIDGATLRPLGESTVKVIQEHPDGTFHLEISDSLPAGTTALENLTRRPEFTRVANNIFRGNNPRGILISVPGEVIIEDNFFSAPYSAILIAADAADWFESGATEDIMIRRNRFQRCGYGYFARPTIEVNPHRQAEPEPAILHGRLTLEENHFSDCPPIVVSITAFREVVFRANQIPVDSYMEINA